MTTTVLSGPATSAPKSTRILGIDTARGVAVLGMIVAHVGLTRELRWTDPGSWLALANGRSSILFALLAGVSLALLSGRVRPPVGAELVAARLRIVIRALLLFALGGVLTALDSGVSVILQIYALLFVCALPFLSWRPRRLLVLAAGWAVIAPPVAVWLADLLPTSCDPEVAACAGAQITDLAVTGDYPALVWITFALTGLALGRSDLGEHAVRVRMLVAGPVMMLAGYGSAWAIGHFTDIDTESGWGRLLSAEPHFGSTFEIVGSLGFAMTVLATLLLSADRLRPALYPIAAVGSIPLTVYAAHIIAIRLLGDASTAPTGNGLLAAFTIAVLAAATVWVATFGRGPIERLVTWVSSRSTRP